MDSDDDNDGMPDAWEETYHLNPLDESDADEDNDNDGFTNIEEYNAGTNPLVKPADDQSDYDGDGILDKDDNDDDNDGMPDAWEINFNLDPYDASDKYRDKDGDKFSNYAEYMKGTNPLKPDDYPGKVEEQETWWEEWRIELLISIGSIVIVSIFGFLALTNKRRRVKKIKRKMNDITDLEKFKKYWQEEVSVLFEKEKVTPNQAMALNNLYNQRKEELLSNIEVTDQSKHVIIQNIKEYVSGNRLDIQDSVLIRSSVDGGDIEENALPTDKEEILHQYKCVLKDAWEDGIITKDEYTLLNHIREIGGITEEEHEKIEREIINKSEEDYLATETEETLSQLEEQDIKSNNSTTTSGNTQWDD